MLKMIGLGIALLALQGCNDIPGCSSERVQPLVKKLALQTLRSNFLIEGLMQLDKSTSQLENIRTESTSDRENLCASDIRWHLVARNGNEVDNVGTVHYRVQLTDDGRVYVTLLDK